jgi:crossover junction endodeoxyribonuclease RuvC
MAQFGTNCRRTKGSHRIIGVDPGLASTGWGVVDYSGNRLRYIAHGCIETKAGRPRAERLFFIYQAIRQVLETYKPAESAIEPSTLPGMSPAPWR